MATDTSLGTKIWVEKYEPRNLAAPVDELAYQFKKITLSKKELGIVTNFSKKNKLSWEVILHLTFGVFISRMSTTSIISYGSASGARSPKNTLTASSDILAIKCTLNEKSTLKNIIVKTEKQIKKKSIALAKAPDEIRYLLIFNSTAKKEKTLHQIDPYRFPMLVCADKKNMTALNLVYHPAFFNTESAAILESHFKLLLLAICQDVNNKTATLDLLTKNERINIFDHWCSPKYPFKLPALKNCFHDIFVDFASKTPNAIAISHQHAEFTYKQINTASSQLALDLIKHGLKKDDCVSVLMDRSPLWIVSMLAIFKAGAIYVPINPKFPEERVNYVINDCKPKYILTNSMHTQAEKFSDVAFIVNEYQYLTDQTKSPDESLLPTIDPEQIAYIIYTSGTTGNPKGVMIRHKSLTNLITWYRGCFKVSAKDRSCQFASQGFDSHLCEIIPFLGSGASVHIVDDNTKLTPPLFFDWLQSKNITIADLPTAYAQILFTLTWPDDLALRLVKIGGESITHYPEKRLPFDVWNGYGPTEATVEATYFNLTSVHPTPQELFLMDQPPIGKPICNYKVYLVDSYLQPVPVGVAGELLIGGIGVAKGYLNRPDLTNIKFIQNPFSADPNDKVYKTGDLARWQADGNLEFIGRVDNQVKIRGYRIELSDIENALTRYPDVNEAIALVKDSVNDKSLVAYVVPNFDKGRYLYQERCLVSLNKNKYIESITEDISKGGIALTGITESIPVGKAARLHLKLPGISEPKEISARLIWQQDNRCGFIFDCPDDEMKTISKSIDYYLSSHNMMEMITSALAKRNLKRALSKKLPEYMIPTSLVTMMEFPLTFSGKIDTKSLPPPEEFEKILHREYIAPKSATEKKLVTLWKNLLKKDDISMSDNFFDLGGTSLTAASLSVCILNQFGISIPANILFDLSYIPILAEFIDTKGVHYSKQSMVQEDIQRDCILPENISPSHVPIPTIKHPQNILLTGAGGFLGIYLLRELLATTQAKVYCLIRKGEFESAAKKLMATIDKFKLANEISLSERRIIAIPSDISADNFGLPLEQYNSLLDKIDMIYHCGAQVNIMASYNKLRGSNVKGTLEIIKFATMHYDKPIHYVSTLSSAYRKDAAGALTEVFPDDHYEDISGGYAISKWVAERLLTIAKERGLPVQIYRSGYISGQASNGQANLNDALFMLMKGCIQLGYAPEMHEKITILPVDYVSKTIVHLSHAHPTVSKVYHLDHPTGIMWRDLVAWLNDYGYHIKIISIKEWQKMLLTIPQNNALFPFLPYYLALPENYQSPPVSVSHATDELTKLSLPYPKITSELLTIYLDFMCREKFIPFPKVKAPTKTSP